MFNILKYFRTPEKPVEYKDYFFYTTITFTPCFQYGIYPDTTKAIDTALHFEDIYFAITNRKKLSWYACLTNDEYDQLVKLIDKTNKIMKLEYLQNIC